MDLNASASSGLCRRWWCAREKSIPIMCAPNRAIDVDDMPAASACVACQVAKGELVMGQTHESETPEMKAHLPSRRQFLKQMAGLGGGALAAWVIQACGGAPTPPAAEAPTSAPATPATATNAPAEQPTAAAAAQPTTAAAAAT